MEADKPIGPTEKDNIKQVHEQMGDLIHEMGDGKRNDGLFFSIGQQLSALSQSNNVPDAVKDKLQSALKDLQSEPFASIQVEKVAEAKQEVSDALDKT